MGLFSNNPGLFRKSRRVGRAPSKWKVTPAKVGNRAITSMAGPFGQGVQFMLKTNQLTFHEARFQRRAEKAIRTLLFRFGGYTQRVAVNKFRHLRTRKWVDKGKVWWNGEPYRSWKYSKPGIAPFPHSKAIPAHIKFAVDTHRRNVIIGPTPRAQRIMKILEYGGPQTLLLNYKKSKRGRLIISHRRSDQREMTVQYKARPFMRPAWQTTVDKRLAEFLRDPKIPESFKSIFSTAAKGKY
tara:strand:+ start:456 stop:1175 length:720 start_codon:yes stop_codon:yes gene_type:complete